MCYCKNVHHKTMDGFDALKRWGNLWSWVNHYFRKPKLSNGATTCGFGANALALQQELNLPFIYITFIIQLWTSFPPPFFWSKSSMSHSLFSSKSFVYVGHWCKSLTSTSPLSLNSKLYMCVWRSSTLTSPLSFISSPYFYAGRWHHLCHSTPYLIYLST